MVAAEQDIGKFNSLFSVVFNHPLPKASTVFPCINFLFFFLFQFILQNLYSYGLFKIPDVLDWRVMVNGSNSNSKFIAKGRKVISPKLLKNNFFIFDHGFSIFICVLFFSISLKRRKRNNEIK